MRKCADTVVNWMIRNNAINEIDRELYIYAVESLVMLLLPLIYAGMIGLCLGNITQGIMVVLPFVILRKFSGGYHAKNFWICTFLSSLLLLLCIMLSIRLKFGWQLVIATVMASVSLFFFSPIDSESRLLDEEEKSMYKSITFYCLLMLGIVNMVLYFFKQYTCMVAFFIGIQLSAGLQIPYILKKLWKRPKENDKCRLVPKRLQSFQKDG